MSEGAKKNMQTVVAQCWDIIEQLQEVSEKICDYYCKYSNSEEYKGQDITKYCDSCPLNKI